MNRLLFAAVFLFSALAFAEDAKQTIKMDSLTLNELATGRPMRANIWYPEGTCVDGSRLCLADSAIADKVLVFSHGAMGSANEYSWLGESLAAYGYIVVGVNHFGESWVYGEDKVNPRASGLIWQRAEDISASLDAFAQKDMFQKPVNWSNIIAVGHSAGGQTASMLAGATFELEQISAYCQSSASVGDRSCGYAKKSEQAPEQFKAKFRMSQADARVKLAVLLDPALGAGAKIESLNAIHLPVLLFGEKNNDFLPWHTQGIHYATHIPNITVKLLEGDEGHFVYINECQNDIKVMDIPLCVDKAGVDRKAVHAKITSSLIAFIQTNEHVFSKATQSLAKREYSQSAPLKDIILFTPKWVFGLLGILIAFGLLQTRTRSVKIQVALILPVTMLILSLSGVVHYLGWQITTLLYWALAVGVATYICLKLMGNQIAHLDSESRKLIIQGSWIPLLVILGIFITRYALGVATAMQLSIIHSDLFPIAVSILLGTWSGFFAARGAVFLRAARVANQGS